MSAAPAFARPPAGSPTPVEKPKRYDALRIVRRDPRLPEGSKVVYAEVDDWAGAAGGVDGKCYPSEALLANLLGKSVRTIRTWLRPLVKFGYLIPKRTGRSYKYRLFWAVAASDRPKTADRRPAESCLSERQKTAAVYKEDPYQKSVPASSSSSSTTAQGKEPRRRDDDRTPPQRKEDPKPRPAADPLANEVRKTLVVCFKNWGYPIPPDKARDPIPDTVIADELRKKGASLLDLQNFLHGDYHDRTLNDPPRSWKHVHVSILD